MKFNILNISKKNKSLNKKRKGQKKRKKKGNKQTKKNKVKGRKLDYYKVGRLSYEGMKAKNELKKIIENSIKLYKILRNDDDIPEWIQHDIILSSDYIDKSYNHMRNRINKYKSNN